MRRTIKFLHTMGAIGIMGAMAALIILILVAPPTEALAAYAQNRAAMGAIAEWLLLPSLGLVLFSGLWSMAVTTAFHNAGWVWVKLASGILVFKGTLLSIQGPAQKEAALSAAVLAGDADPAVLGLSAGEEWGTLWVIMAIAVANVVLGVWRPRFGRRRQAATASGK
jgi:hypothetical protein